MKDMKERVITGEKIKDFELYLISEEKSRNTVEKYIRDVRAFSEYIGDNEITKQAAVEYKKQLIEKKYAVRSINSMIASINCMLSFIGMSECKVKSIKQQRSVYCPEDKELTKSEYLQLVDAANRKENSRLCLILQTICGTGIRVSELVFITVEAVRSGQACVSLKGKTRTVFIVKKLQKKLLRYAAEQKIKSGPIFITRTGRVMSRTNIWREMKKLCKTAGVNSSKVFPHNLRHLFARTFYSVEKDIAKLADILGHNSIDTTRIYIVTTGNEHRERMESLRLIV